MFKYFELIIILSILEIDIIGDLYISTIYRRLTSRNKSLITNFSYWLLLFEFLNIFNGSKLNIKRIKNIFYNINLRNK